MGQEIRGIFESSFQCCALESDWAGMLSRCRVTGNVSPGQLAIRNSDYSIIILIIQQPLLSSVQAMWHCLSQGVLELLLNPVQFRGQQVGHSS